MTRASFRLLDTGLLTAAENMALDEVLLEEAAAGRSRPTLRFLRFSPPAALVGRHQEISREIREDFCRDHGIDIGRRITGGGAIYFQSSALGWELIGPAGTVPFEGSFDAILARIGRAAAQALVLLGLPAQYRPRNDIEVDGRKISGTGGAAVTGGYLFQGTLLIENEIELFLKSLRVPVEKLKKREIESLRQRVCFLNELLDPPPPLDTVKAAFIQAFANDFGLVIEPGPLTDREAEHLASRRGYYSSPEWVYGRRNNHEPASEYVSTWQAESGTFRFRMMVEPGARRIRQTLITGDFFVRPERLVLDLEASLKGVRAEAPAVHQAALDLLNQAGGEFLGVSHDDIAQALAETAERIGLGRMGLEPDEINELFLINLAPSDLGRQKLKWLLLPYCSKKMDCGFRFVPDCGQCGECDFDRLYGWARAAGMEPFSIQSFEHLMEVLDRIRSSPDGCFLGSCCEAFFSKHQREMRATGARGVLVNLDSTTCYDLGKGTDAYAGRFDHQTEMNVALIEKIHDRIAHD